MGKRLMAGLIVALAPLVGLASSSGLELAVLNSTLATPTDEFPIAGVVTGVTNDKLSIMAPVTDESGISDAGKVLTVEKGMSFQTVTAQGSQAQIFRDGKIASLKDIKEGDVVHAAYDPGTKAFTDIRAVSSHEFGSNQQQAKHDLGISGSSAPPER